MCENSFAMEEAEGNSCVAMFCIPSLSLIVHLLGSISVPATFEKIIMTFADDDERKASLDANEIVLYHRISCGSIRQKIMLICIVKFILQGRGIRSDCGFE